MSESAEKNKPDFSGAAQWAVFKLFNFITLNFSLIDFAQARQMSTVFY